MANKIEELDSSEYESSEMESRIVNREDEETRIKKVETMTNDLSNNIKIKELNETDETITTEMTTSDTNDTQTNNDDNETNDIGIIVNDIIDSIIEELIIETIKLQDFEMIKNNKSTKIKKKQIIKLCLYHFY